MIARKDEEKSNILGPILEVKYHEKWGKYCNLMEKKILLEQNNHSRAYIKYIN